MNIKEEKIINNSRLERVKMIFNESTRFLSHIREINNFKSKHNYIKKYKLNII